MSAFYLSNVEQYLFNQGDDWSRFYSNVGTLPLDSIEFDDGFAIVKLKPPSETVGFTLEQSSIRRKYGVTVVGVKAPGEDFTYAVPQTKISAHHVLIVSGPVELIERFAARP